MADVTNRGAVWRLTLMAGACVMTFIATRGQAAVPQIVLPHAPAGAPNVVVVLLDDVGFGAASTFGGASPTPALDELASDGLRYNRFHTTGICSPTRASLLTGRNSHAANVGTVMNSATGYPGYQGILQRNTATIAEILKQNGYSTALFGKWHLTPDWEASPSGPFDRWPTGVGFETFYGFMGGETDSYHPTLYQGTTQLVLEEKSGYHLTEDLADRAIDWMGMQRATDPSRPFFLYFAPGATHAPLQAPAEWIARFHGKFNHGWDIAREEIFARQKALGVIPADAALTPRPAELPAWSSLSADEQKVAARLMEIYAAFLAHTDAQVGRLASALKSMDQYDNTLFVYIVGDNGSSGEGGLKGSSNYMGDLQGLSGGINSLLRQFDQLGGPGTAVHFPASWAWATNTPFQWTKQVASHLGATRNPMVISWPDRVRDRGGLRQQFSHVNDITPTILEATGLSMPDTVNGVTQRAMDGVSLLYTFDKSAEERHRTQYFNVFGNRSVYQDGWMASAFHGTVPWKLTFRDEKPFDLDSWELYNLDTDFTQAADLAATEPEKLKALQALFAQEAENNNVLPLHGPLTGDRGLPSHVRGRSEVRYLPGSFGLVESAVPNMRNASHTITARLQIPAAGAHGVIATLGGDSAGWSLYLDENSRPVYHYKLFDVETLVLTGDSPLPTGEVELSYEFTRTGKGPYGGGESRLLVNGQEVAKGTIERTAPALFTIHETFDVGLDTGSAAGQYSVPSRFAGGTIEHVDVTTH